MKRQLEGVCNEVTGLSSQRAGLDKSVEELKSLEGKVLNCDRVTTNMAEEIRWIGLNFEYAQKRVHGVEAMVESHKASISQLINRVHNLEHPAVSSTSTAEVGEAKVPANGGETHSGEPGDHECTSGDAHGPNAPLGNYAQAGIGQG